MILEEETFKVYGYYSWELALQSHNKILAACNDCGKVRKLQKKVIFKLFPIHISDPQALFDNQSIHHSLKLFPEYLQPTLARQTRLTTYRRSTQYKPTLVVYQLLLLLL